MFRTRRRVYESYYLRILRVVYTRVTKILTKKIHKYLQYINALCSYRIQFNPLNAELNPICYLLTLLAHHFLHVSRIGVKSLTLRLLMSYIYIYMYVCIHIYIYIYIYGAPILDVSRSHTTTHHSR